MVQSNRFSLKRFFAGSLFGFFVGLLVITFGTGVGFYTPLELIKVSSFAAVPFGFLSLLYGALKFVPPNQTGKGLTTGTGHNDGSSIHSGGSGGCDFGGGGCD